MTNNDFSADHIQLLKDLVNSLGAMNICRNPSSRNKNVSPRALSNAGREHPEQQKNETRYPFAHRPRTGFSETCVAILQSHFDEDLLGGRGILHPFHGRGPARGTIWDVPCCPSQWSYECATLRLPCVRAVCRHCLCSCTPQPGKTKSYLALSAEAASGLGVAAATG